MSVISFWSDKGGTGKSLLTAMAASWKWQDPRPVVIVDLDPQGDSREWAQRAGVSWHAPETPDAAAFLLKSLTPDHTVLVDCPPGRLRDQRLAGVGVISADALILPTGSGRPDLNALGRAILVVEELNRKGASIKAGIVLNHFRETSRSRVVEEGLRLAKLPLLGRLGERTAFPEAFSEGRSLTKLSGSGAHEARMLCESIESWLLEL
jgi:cellulose biosynthesis protein BcsQ